MPLVPDLVWSSENAMHYLFRAVGPSIFRARLVLALGLTIIFAGGCHDTCFFGIVNPPNNSLTVVGGSTTPSACSLPQTTTAMKVTGNIVRGCTNCASSEQVSHVYMFVSGVELHPGAVADAHSADWLEIAPELAQNPRFVDLAEIPALEPHGLSLNISGRIPVGTYYQIRLRLADSSRSDLAELSAAKACVFATRSGCLVNADGSVHEIETLDGEGFLSVQTAIPIDLRAGQENQLKIQFRPEWLLQQTSGNRMKLSPVLHGEIVAEPSGALAD